ncbi:flagellar hook-basal body complex protein FliE [Thalassobius vesicularis]|uniref:Flagellar hook-basal body complex protein FliE n=1 Tax=Thalassobius vesicularis TaxID=1294297 RepID=A0A4V3UYZ7_9RHOB|nr:flagellar hook-basal body complex protein FliE [Thalassobius vesicularis]THD73817.1 flagellar hook-basal body complex protein FliE [Thalassobius vesicularis]
MEIRTPFAAQNYAAAKPATSPLPGSGTAGEMLKDAARDFAQSMQEAENTAKAAMSGNADPHALVQALAQTELAVETAVAVRDKVVEAYQEILRMPV